MDELLTGQENLQLMADLKRLGSGEAKRVVTDLMERFDVRPRRPALPSASFSGGNQQKLVLAREIAPAPRILLVGQPTRGVDIGAIEFIHRQLVAIRDSGCAVLTGTPRRHPAPDLWAT